MKLPILVATLILAAIPEAVAQSLSREERRIVERVDANTEAAIALLDRTVSIGSATGNLTGVRQVADVMAGELRTLGFTTRWEPLPREMNRAGHLVAERTGTTGKRLLLLGHLDTVLEGEAFARNGNEARGNGVADMKGGNVVLIQALKALYEAGALEGRRVAVLFTGDEESPGEPLAESRRLLVDLARRSDAALSFEATVGNTATVARRGASFWTLEVTGSTGHSAGIFGPARGSGAIFEAARILAAFHDQLREEYLTFNPAVIVGGTDVTFDEDRGTAAAKMNIVPQKVVVRGDLRFISEEQKERTRARMRAIVAEHLRQTGATIQFQDAYPAMPPSPANRELLRQLDQVSRDIDAGPVEALPAGERGAGDLSFAAPYVAGLDGLGILTTGVTHAPGETADLASLPMIIKRAALLMYRLTR
jgi:glutamate carboxypeptidase